MVHFELLFSMKYLSSLDDNSIEVQHFDMTNDIKMSYYNDFESDSIKYSIL